MKYDPQTHHRRSMRWKGNDYAGGGEYFIALCAHREFIRPEAVAPEKIGLTNDELARLAHGRLLVVCPFAEARTTRENALKCN
jgi:hypothetical protein